LRSRGRERGSFRGAHAPHALAMAPSPSRTFLLQGGSNLKKNRFMSEAEEAVLLARVDKVAAQLDAGEGIPIERVREDIRGWARK
ncbi:MAG: hypothetical protein WBX14_02815, partial [Candidatus Udaeobacter sp.]